MSNLVKQSQLSEVAVALWNKVKEKTNENFVNATYSEADQTITFTKVDGNTVEVPLTDLVSKSNANVITGETLITDGYILGGVIAKLDNQQNTMHAANLPHHFGYKSARVTTSQTLTHITIGIHDSIAVGTQITGIKVGAIKVSDNTISEYIIDGATATVQENKNTQLTNCTRSVVIALPQPFTPAEESWFCVTCLSAAWGERGTGSTGDGCSEQAAMPAVGSAVRVKASGFLGKYLLHTDKISLNDLANVANGAVKTVNNQMPNAQGDVTIGIDNIADLRTELDNRVLLSDVENVANKIPRIEANGKLPTSIIPELAITRVKTATDKNGALALIGDTEAHIQTGDVVVITGENNAIFMYNGGTDGVFENSFIELSIGDGTVKTVNGQSPDGTGAVTITADQINLSDNATVLEDELNAKVKTIGSQAAQDGNINLTLVLGTDEYELQANGTKITELPLMTAQEVQTIIDLFV